MSQFAVSILQNEAKKLRQQEDMKRREHIQLQDSLQNTWDQLVNLRSHISLFKSAIEEVRLEEAAYYVHMLGESNINSSDLTSEMATRLGSLHALREKVRVKEGMKSKIALMDEQLIGLSCQIRLRSCPIRPRFLRIRQHHLTLLRDELMLTQLLSRKNTELKKQW